MRNESTFEKKYCYHCGRLVQAYAHKCPYCLHDLCYSTEERTKICRYCRKRIFVKSNYCEFCSTKVKRDKTEEAISDYDLAFVKLEAQIEQNKLYNPTDKIFKTVNYYGGMKQFVGLKRISIKCSKDGIKIQTLTNGQKEIKINDFIGCYKLTAKNSEKLLNIVPDLPEDNLADTKYIIIETTKGYIILDDSLDSNLILSVLYNNLNGIVAEFDFGFINANHDEVFNKIDKMIAEL